MMKTNMSVFNMVPVVALALFSTLILNTGCERIKLITQNENYNFFPLKSDYLEFNVKAEENVRIVLTNSYQFEPPYYEIVLGSSGDTQSYIRRDNNPARLNEHKGSVLGKSEYKKFWISLDHNNGIVKIGSNYNRPLLYYSDPNYIKLSYFGITTNGKSAGFWDFGTDLIMKCVKKTSIEKIVYERCIKLDSGVYVPEDLITPDVV